jgi:phenylacetate-CoA ligase
MSDSSVCIRFVSGILFSLHERLQHHDTVVVHRQLEETQWPAERLQALQVDRLRALLVDARQHMPYYRDLFEQSGFDPVGIQSITDLKRLPFLTKSFIRANTEELKHPQAKGLSRFNTGGFIWRALFSHWQQAHQPRRGRQMAHHSLAGRGHWRPRNRRLGLSH